MPQALHIAWRIPYKREIAIILGLLSFVFSLPIIITLTLATSGLSAVSNTLVKSNPVTHKVTIFNPDGTVRTVLSAETVWPLHGKVTTEFGADDLPYQAHHTGIDIAASYSTPFTAFMNGTVTKVGSDISEGSFVYVDHGNGIVSHYLHLSSILTSAGQAVTPQTILGLEGSSGYSTGPHVHFEIRVNGIPVNPREFEVGNP